MESRNRVQHRTQGRVRDRGEGGRTSCNRAFRVENIIEEPLKRDERGGEETVSFVWVDLIHG